MTKENLLNLFGGLNQVGNLQGVRFSYAVARNLHKLKPEIEAILKANEITDEYKEFDAKRVELAKKHAKKDEKGEPVVVMSQYQFENETAFKAEFEVLKAENKELVEAREKQEKDYQELLKEEIEVTLHKVKEADLPSDISVAQLTPIFEIVEE